GCLADAARSCSHDSACSDHVEGHARAHHRMDCHARRRAYSTGGVVMPERRPSTLVIALEHRLNADAAAQLLRNIELLGRPYERLRTHFGSLRFLARGDGATPSTSGDVALVRLPDFRGVAGALQHSFRTFRVSWHALDDANLLLIPVPGFASLPVW